MYEDIIAKLNAEDISVRLNAAREVGELIRGGKLPVTPVGEDVNNHIHTTYSFSPYSPTMAVYKSIEAGLWTAGIMDHDSISGAREFVEAARLMGINATVGIECRADMSGTVLKGRRFNNPDQIDVAYSALHAVPHSGIDEVTAFFAPRIELRNTRNRLMVERINAIIDIDLDFDRDVLPLSDYARGGSVTERHLLYAVATKLIAKVGKENVLATLDSMGIKVSDKIRGYLSDMDNPCFSYDLLGVLKSDMVERFYIPATDELPTVTEVAELARRVGAIYAYAYLGDVGNSVTGDKKAQRFEDEYLDELFASLKALGFNAVTYMPSRNTDEQIARLQTLCKKHGLMEISGEDINTPRQQFVCVKQRAPQFEHLKASAFALIGSENAEKYGDVPMFDPSNTNRFEDMDEMIAHYEALGKKGGYNV